MSRIFTLFTQYDTYTDSSRALDAVINRDMRLIELYRGVLNNVRDSQDNNLLHLAILNEQKEMVAYLLDNHVDKNCKNKFGLTPWDYAIRSHNKDLIDTYLRYNTVDVSVLKTKNNQLSTQVNNLLTENTNLKKNNKRLFEQNDMLEAKVIRLSGENDELVRSNKKLKTSVDSLTQAMRK